MSDGRLILVGTPIGNVGDMSPRAIEVLNAVDLIAAEDTRHSGRLFKTVGVAAKELQSLNEHNETERIPAFLERLSRGQKIALVSDAGMPGISDPGERLVAAVAQAGYTVEVVPGPTAAVTALVASGLDAGRFVFEGFLPRKGKVRAERLETLTTEERTIILYESPHRVAQTIADLVATFGPRRQVSISRELTKLYDETWRGTLGEAVEHLHRVSPRGEYVLVVAGALPKAPASSDEIDASLRSRLDAGLSKRDAANEVAKELKVSKREVYSRALSL